MIGRQGGVFVSQPIRWDGSNHYTAPKGESGHWSEAAAGGPTFTRGGRQRVTRPRGAAPGEVLKGCVGGLSKASCRSGMPRSSDQAWKNDQNKNPKVSRKQL